MPQQSMPDARDRRLAFALIVAGTVIGIAGTDLVLPAVPGMPAALGGDLPRAQLVLAAFVAGAACGLMLFGSLYLIFLSLTPKRYRGSDCLKWPGPAFVTLWWLGTTALLPQVLGTLGGYDLTYGSLAGVMIALIFFFVIGLGLVIGAHLNAALAEVPESEPGHRMEAEEGK